VNGDLDGISVAVENLINGIVDGLHKDMVEAIHAVVTDVHTRQTAHCL
jgi:hypothetical protein